MPKHPLTVKEQPGDMENMRNCSPCIPFKAKRHQPSCRAPATEFNIKKLFRSWQFWGGGGWWWSFAGYERLPPGLNPSHPRCRRNRFNKPKFTALLEHVISVLEAYYLHDNWCQALFIGLNARSFRIHFPKLFSPALRAGCFSFLPKQDWK